MSTIRLCLTGLLVSAALPMLATPSQAQYAAQLYPYCSLSSGTGGSNCYISSREQCGRNACISNPWYIGAQRARPYLEGRKALEPHYVRP